MYEVERHLINWFQNKLLDIVNMWRIIIDDKHNQAYIIAQLCTCSLFQIVFQIWSVKQLFIQMFNIQW